MCVCVCVCVCVENAELYVVYKNTRVQIGFLPLLLRFDWMMMID